MGRVVESAVTSSPLSGQIESAPLKTEAVREEEEEVVVDGGELPDGECSFEAALLERRRGVTVEAEPSADRSSLGQLPWAAGEVEAEVE